jgi:DNA-binding CsgD family transcriptional regulator
LQESPSTLTRLASVLQASPKSDALLILGRLLDSLPIGFHVTDCGQPFHLRYGNQVWERWLAPEKLPIVGKPMSEVFPTAAQSGILDIMAEVCRTAQPRHLKGFEFRELGILARSKTGETSRWDWEIYPLSGPDGEVTHLLNVVMDVSERAPRKGRPAASDRQAANRRREAASGVLRIFGVAPGSGSRKPAEPLSEREQQVADLLTLGFTNAGIAQHLNLSANTVASHVGRILAKLGFRSRTQIATWVIEGRLAAAPVVPAEVHQN